MDANDTMVPFPVLVPSPCLTPPPTEQSMLDSQSVQNFADHKNDQLVDGLRMVVKGGHGGDDPYPHAGQLEQVFQVDLVEGGLPGDHHQGAPLLECHICAPLDEI